MKTPHLFAGPPGRLLVFIVGALLSLVVGVWVAAPGAGMLGISRPFFIMALTNGVAIALLLALSLFLLRREPASIAVLGLPTNGPRIRELAFGFILSAVLFQAVAWVQSARVGASWHFQGWAGVSAAMTGLGLTACMVLAEELVFRGVGLRYLRAMYGNRPAVTLSALLFGAYHVIGSPNWGMGLVFQFVLPALGGLFFGWAVVRSGGLALAIGLHWGGNWIQASVAGFGPVAAYQPQQALWQIPITAADFKVLTAPDLLPRLPYIAALAIAAAFTWYVLRALGKTRRHDLRNG